MGEIRIWMAALVISQAACAVGVESEKSMDSVKKIASGIVQRRQEGERELLTQREDVVDSLVQIVRGPALSNEQRSAVGGAIRVLGELRASEAAETLADRLLFEWKSAIED